MKVDSSFIKKSLIILILCIFASTAVTFWYTARMEGFQGFRLLLSSVMTLRFWYREFFLFVVFVFVGLHFLVPIRQFYNWIFKYRWLIGIGVLVFLTILRFHGDSIAFYYNSIQPGVGDEFAKPIFGVMRAIRSDEFVVSTPNALASQYGSTPFGVYNDILRGTETLNLVTGVYIGLPTLILAPWELAYAILPVEFAYSFCWYAPLILGFLMTFELFYIISKNKLVSLTGTFLIIFSSWYLWWGFSSYFINAPGVVVCLYYFVKENKNYKKILYALGTAICFASFIVNLYPAWQVPMGYMFLAIGIWFIHDNWDRIKSFTKRDWMLLVTALILCFALVANYFLSISEYVEIINNTAYPGARLDSGSFYLNKLFYYIQSPFYAYKDIGNPSEMGVFFSLFPIPTIAALWCWIKEKKKDWLTAGLLIVQVPMLIYASTGVPEIVAKITLLSYTTAFRIVDIIGLIQIYFIVILFSRYKNIKCFHWIIAMSLSIGTALIAAYYSWKNFPGYLNILMMFIMVIVITLLSFVLLYKVNKKIQTITLIGIIGISLFTGIYIRPISVGTSAIYSKPVAQEIQKINQKDTYSKWIAYGGGIETPAFAVACGASTINSVNTYPNLPLWEKLDTTGVYNEVYNRYAHIKVVFTNEPTSFEINQADYITLNLSYEDIIKTGVSYLFVNEVTGPLEFDVNNGFVALEQIYNESGAAIYKFIY
ncbi:MAG: hypothetical protein ACLUHF_04335 [Faecalitalea cylindroides]